MKKWRTALLGLGRMGRHHLRKLDQDARFELLAVVDPDLQQPLDLEHSEPRILTRLQDLAELELDCAVVATPTETHYEVVKKLLEMNLHVLVEKPAASTFQQCQKLVEIARNRGLKLAVGHVERGNPVVTALKEVMTSGLLGLPVHVNTSRAGAYPPKVREGNHVILDLAVHDLDIIRMLLGPLQVTHAIGHSTALPGIYDTAEISLVSKEGITATVHVNWLTPQKDRKVRVTGTLASCEINYIEQSCQIFGLDIKQRLAERMLSWPVESTQFCDIATVPVLACDALSRQLAEFDLALQGKEHGLAAGDELSESVLMVEKAVELMDKSFKTNFFQEVRSWKPAFHLEPNPVELN